MKAKCVKGNCGYEFENDNPETFFDTIDEGRILFEIEDVSGGGHWLCVLPSMRGTVYRTQRGVKMPSCKYCNEETKPNRVYCSKECMQKSLSEQAKKRRGAGKE